MTDFHVARVAVSEIAAHPNADRLEITHVGGYPVVIAKGSFKPSDDAIYIPVGALVDKTMPQFSFLQSPRIRAKQFLGVFSMGLLIPTPEEVSHMGPNDDYASALNIIKYEPPDDTCDELEAAPALDIHYTDIEPLRRWPNLFKDGDMVVLTEKLDGGTLRVLCDAEGVHVGQSRTWKKEGSNKWWSAARRFGLDTAMRKHKGLCLFGEVYGHDATYGAVQKGFSYDTTTCVGFRVFDIFSIELGSYLSWPNVVEFVRTELPLCQTVPVLYEGPWHEGLVQEYGDGPTTLGGGHIREGFVVKPWSETYSRELNGRLILKYHGETYLLKKG